MKVTVSDSFDSRIKKTNSNLTSFNNSNSNINKRNSKSILSQKFNITGIISLHHPQNNNFPLNNKNPSQKLTQFQLFNQTQSKISKNIGPHYSNKTSLSFSSPKSSSMDNININLNKKKNKFRKLSPRKKIKYIQKIIEQKPPNKPCDGLATKRKRYSLGYLINRFNDKENVADVEENKLCKVPYPLLYFISNRKLGNNSSNLITNILRGENGKLTQEQQNTIKNSNYNINHNQNLLNFINFYDNFILNNNNFNLKANFLKASNSFFNCFSSRSNSVGKFDKNFEKILKMNRLKDKINFNLFQALSMSMGMTGNFNYNLLKGNLKKNFYVLKKFKKIQLRI